MIIDSSYVPAKREVVKATFGSGSDGVVAGPGMWKSNCMSSRPHFSSIMLVRIHQQRQSTRVQSWPSSLTQAVVEVIGQNTGEGRLVARTMRLFVPSCRSTTAESGRSSANEDCMMSRPAVAQEHHPVPSSSTSSIYSATASATLTRRPIKHHRGEGDSLPTKHQPRSPDSPRH